MDCVFCKIAKGEISDYVFWEDDEFVAFLDINPYILGHVMVIPKEHSRWVWDIKENKYIKYMLAVKKVAEILKKAFNTDCIQEVIAGMGVPHSHIHLLPRTENDGFPEIPKQSLNPKPSEKQMNEIFEKIKSNL
jgi:histidine triad (HIT) family protein